MPLLFALLACSSAPAPTARVTPPLPLHLQVGPPLPVQPNEQYVAITGENALHIHGHGDIDGDGYDDLAISYETPWATPEPVSYTHLTLPTIYSV